MKKIFKMSEENVKKEAIIKEIEGDEEYEMELGQNRGTNGKKMDTILRLFLFTFFSALYSLWTRCYNILVKP